GRIVSDRVQTAAKQIQNQVVSEYQDISINIDKVNEITDQIVSLNKAIMAKEAVGGSANDLRDSRDKLADELSGFMRITVSEKEETSMYTIVCNGTTMVNGITKMDLKFGPEDPDDGSIGDPNVDYGFTDYKIEIGDTGIELDTISGKLKADVDAIAENKSYIDQLAKMAGFLLTNFNAQHKQGVGMDVNCTTGTNFFGEDGKLYLWDDDKQCVRVATQTTTSTVANGELTKTEIVTGDADMDDADALKAYRLIQALSVNSVLTETDGEQKIAARMVSYDTSKTADQVAAEFADTSTMASAGVKQYCWKLKDFDDNGYAGTTVDNTVNDLNGTADGSNAVLVGKLLNLGNNDRDKCSIGKVSLENFYNATMTGLGVDSEATDTKLITQEDVITQVETWRTEVAGVNWDEELTNMIMFQTGYSACSRCLTTMDEMLDRLINSTGTVGR
ncbi:MAG: flagellar basal body rod C-terminal domain-containing protein, partial [Selenomonadaceae bacterium]